MTTTTFSETGVVTAPSTTRLTNVLARRAIGVERVLFGLIFFVCGLNGLFDFLPRPAEPGPEGAMAFATALLKAGYFFPLLKGVETLGGALILAKRFVPLSLVLLAPVVVNIFAFHLFLAPSGMVMALVLVVLEAHLAWTERAAFRPLFKA